MTTGILNATFRLLPEHMNSPEARRMLLAIGYQESRFAHRKQVGGPARGFWQFEQAGGVHGVLTHPATKAHARRLLVALKYPETYTAAQCYAALEHNDVLACGFARLLLFSLPGALPTLDEQDKGWQQYVAAWRPGKPHPETWPQAWKFATTASQLKAA